jgi:hypothetical protein
VGGLAAARATAQGPPDTQGILQATYPTDLTHYRGLQARDPVYPLVSLYNLEEVPPARPSTSPRTPRSRITWPLPTRSWWRSCSGRPRRRWWMLQSRCSRPDPSAVQVRGDMVDAGGPMGPDQLVWGGWWSVLLTLGSAHPRVHSPRVSTRSTPGR